MTWPDWFLSLIGKGASANAEIKVNVIGRSSFSIDLLSLCNSKVVRAQAEAYKRLEVDCEAEKYKPNNISSRQGRKRRKRTSQEAAF